MITHNPLHGSGEAVFPHPALALGDDAHAPQRIGMTDSRQRQPASDEAPHAVPKDAAILAPLRPWADLGSPGSRARCFRTCTGSLTARDSSAPRDIGAPDGAFRFSLQRRRPGVIVLRGSIPGPHVPLSTLRRRPCGRLRMTRGRCGSLLHFRMTLSFTTPRRF